jgi:hypothetical protein
MEVGVCSVMMSVTDRSRKLSDGPRSKVAMPRR